MFVCDVGCDLGWAMPLVWGCFGMVGPLQESAEAGCALQHWTRSAAAVTIAVDLGSWLADVKTGLLLTADRAHSFISETDFLKIVSSSALCSGQLKPRP